MNQNTKPTKEAHEIRILNLIQHFNIAGISVPLHKNPHWRYNKMLTGKEVDRFLKHFLKNQEPKQRLLKKVVLYYLQYVCHYAIVLRQNTFDYSEAIAACVRIYKQPIILGTSVNKLNNFLLNFALDPL